MTNAHILTLVGISLAQALAMVSPGPAFLLVSRVAASESRRTALATGIGVASAATVWAVAATFGVAVLLARYEAVYAVIQVAGAVYLIALGLSAWRDSGADGDVASPAARRTGAAFQRGLWLSLGNPKIVMFYAGIFVSLMPADAPRWLALAALALVVAQEFVWYVLVATIFSRPTIQAAYRRVRGRIERIMGAVFIALGARIVALAHV